MTLDARAKVRIRCADLADAERLRRALAVDDAGLAGIAVDGRDLVVTAAGPSALGLLRTLDDVLGCLRAAAPTL